jgi:hypothetical protein
LTGIAVCARDDVTTVTQEFRRRQMVMTSPRDALDGVEHGMVLVHALGLGHSVAACSCGWAGGRRFLRAAAEQDAWEHAMVRHCEVSSPLVVAW